MQGHYDPPRFQHISSSNSHKITRLLGKKGNMGISKKNAEGNAKNGKKVNLDIGEDCKSYWRRPLAIGFSHLINRVN